MKTKSKNSKLTLLSRVRLVNSLHAEEFNSYVNASWIQ
jgi:hypothetical protein